MTKIYLLILATFAFIQIPSQWTTIKLDNRVSIDLPLTPELQEFGDKKIYQIVESDYIINVLSADMSAAPNFAAITQDISGFYKGVVDGTLVAANDSKLLNERVIQIDKFEGREIQFTKDFNGLNDILVMKRIVLIDKVFYTFDIWYLDGKEKGKTKLKKKLFRSISVNQ